MPLTFSVFEAISPIVDDISSENGFSSAAYIQEVHGFV